MALMTGGRKAKRKEKKRKAWSKGVREGCREASQKQSGRATFQIQTSSWHPTQRLWETPPDLRGNPAFLWPFSGLLNDLLPPPFLMLQTDYLTQAVNIQRIIELKRVIVQDPAASRHARPDPRWNSCCSTWQGINLNSTLKIRVGGAHHVPNLVLRFKVCLWLGDIPSALLLLPSHGGSLSFLGAGSLPARSQPWHLSLHSSIVSRKVEIFHFLDYASTFKLLSGNVKARRNILETVTELKWCKKKWPILMKLPRTATVAA